jgi:hypothetical protein
MSQRSKEMIIYLIFVVVVASAVQYFRYHQFHWWLLIGPAIGTPLAIIASRRQKHWDELRLRRERGEDTLSQQTLVDAKAAEQEPSN